MSEQELSQGQQGPEDVPGAPSPEAPPQPAAAATAPQAPPKAPETAQPGETPEQLKKRLAELEAYNRRLRGAQTAEQQRANQIAQQYEQEMARLRQMSEQMEQRELSQLPEEAKALYEAQKAARQYAELLEQQRKQNWELQWRAHLRDTRQQLIEDGVPPQIIDEGVSPVAMQQDPQLVKDAMHAAAVAYWKRQASQAKQPPKQEAPQPQEAPPPQPPQVTRHTEASSVGDVYDDLNALKERTEKTGKNTTFEALKRLQQEQRRR